MNERDILRILDGVPDPEIPVLNVMDLGIVRSVHVDGSRVHLTITPTYSGCPATQTIAEDIHRALKEAGCKDIRIDAQLSPAWTTDWISEEGRKKLLAFGIAPPVEPEADAAALFARSPVVPCPHCQSNDTRLVSQFGSTPCKAMYRCNACLEPFDYFKCLK